ncbi:hypothetical protein HDU85_001786, partial [Gaertneriomyces sp. JEL0708]
MRHLQSAPVLSSLSADVTSVILSRDTQSQDVTVQVHNHLDVIGILTATLKANEEHLKKANEDLKKDLADFKKDVADWKKDLNQKVLDLQKATDRTSLLHLHSQCLKLMIDLKHAHQTNPEQITLGRAPAILQLHNQDRIDISHVIPAGERFDSTVIRGQIRAYVEAASELLDREVKDAIMIEQRAQLTAFTEILKETQIHGDTFYIDPPH